MCDISTHPPALPRESRKGSSEIQMGAKVGSERRVLLLLEFERRILYEWERKWGRILYYRNLTEGFDDATDGSGDFTKRRERLERVPISEKDANVLNESAIYQISNACCKVSASHPKLRDLSHGSAAARRERIARDIPTILSDFADARGENAFDQFIVNRGAKRIQVHFVCEFSMHPPPS